MYKILSKNVRSLPLDISSELFAKEWLSCIGNPKSDLTKLIEYMQPVFETWGDKLCGLAHHDDINYLTLCRLLSPEPDKALELILGWIGWAKNTSSVQEELEYIFIERVRKIKYKPTQARPAMVEYIVAKDFKMGLYNRIVSICGIVRRDAFYYISECDFSSPEFLLTEDFLLLKNLNLDAWQSYILYLLKEGYTSMDRAHLTKTNRRNLFREEKQIWESLKQML